MEPVFCTTSEKLLVAAGLGNVSLCSIFIKGGANVHAVDAYGRTPLFQAAWHGDAAICRLLIDAGALSGAQGGRKTLAGRTPIHAVAENGHAEKHVDAFFALMDHGLSVTDQDHSGLTPLQLAARDGHRFMCLALIASGADPLQAPPDMQGLTPRQAAARGGFTDRLLSLVRASESNDPKDALPALLDLAVKHIRDESAAAIRALMAAEAIDGLLNLHAHRPFETLKAPHGSAQHPHL